MNVRPELTAITDCLYRVSGKAVIMVEKRLLIVCESDEEWFSLPGGGIEYGEDVPAAVLRELEEEIGITERDVAVLPDVLFVTSREIIHGVPRLQLYYRAVPRATTLEVKNNEFELTHKWVSVEELSQTALSPATQEALPHLIKLLEES